MRELFIKEKLENKTVKGTRSAKGGKESVDKRRLEIFYPTLPEKTEKRMCSCNE